MEDCIEDWLKSKTAMKPFEGEYRSKDRQVEDCNEDHFKDQVEVEDCTEDNLRWKTALEDCHSQVKLNLRRGRDDNCEDGVEGMRTRDGSRKSSERTEWPNRMMSKTVMKIIWSRKPR